MKIARLVFSVTVFLAIYLLASTKSDYAATGVKAQSNLCGMKGDGDADCNGVINNDDYKIWLSSQCQINCAETRADFDGNGKVDDRDYLILNGQDQSSTLTGTPAPSNADIPAAPYSLADDAVAPGRTGRTPALPATSSTGDQKTLVILFNFTDDTSQPYTQSQVAAKMFSATDSVNNFYKETSYGKMSLSGDVTNWLPINSSGANCSSNYDPAWTTLARQAASGAGYNLSNYVRLIYLWPYKSSCGWIGLSDSPGGQAWINGVVDGITFAHEIGHNLQIAASRGLGHVAEIACGSRAIDDYSRCTVDYGNNYFDLMNTIAQNPNMYHFSSANKAALGWLTSSQITDVTGSGTYTINNLEQSSTGPQVLRISKTNSLGAPEYYYIEYRAPLGFDNWQYFQTNGGVVIHIYSSDSRSPAFYKPILIDATPGDGNFDNAALKDGVSGRTTFTDSLSNLTITAISHTATTATLQITLPGPTQPPIPTNTPAPIPSYFTDDFESGSLTTHGWQISTSGSSNQAGVINYGQSRGNVMRVSFSGSGTVWSTKHFSKRIFGSLEIDFYDSGASPPQGAFAHTPMIELDNGTSQYIVQIPDDGTMYSMIVRGLSHTSLESYLKGPARSYPYVAGWHKLVITWSPSGVWSNFDGQATIYGKVEPGIFALAGFDRITIGEADPYPTSAKTTYLDNVVVNYTGDAL